MDSTEQDLYDAELSPVISLGKFLETHYFLSLLEMLSHLTFYKDEGSGGNVKECGPKEFQSGRPEDGYHKEPQLGPSLGGSLASTWAPAPQLREAATGRDDDVVVIPALTPSGLALPPPSTTSAPPSSSVLALRRSSSLAQAEIDTSRGKASVSSSEFEIAPSHDDEEIVMMKVQVRASASALHNSKLVGKFVKMILFSQDWEERKFCSLNGILTSSRPFLV